MRGWINVVRAVVQDVASIAEKTPSASSKDKAVSRWQVFLGSLLVDVAEGVSNLAEVGNVRSMVMLERSMYEYQQKAQYFSSHKNEAFEQIASIGARKYLALTKMAHPNPRVGVALAAEYLNWKRTAGERDEWSGQKRQLTMHLANADPSKIKQDKNGTKYTEEFQTAYGIPSLYVHGEPIMMAEVFKDLTDDTTLQMREQFRFFDTLTATNAACTIMSNFCVQTTKAYNLGIERIYALRPQVARVINSSAAVHGTGLTVTIPQTP